jgi:surface carbohydrate biosynthesis protein
MNVRLGPDNDCVESDMSFGKISAPPVVLLVDNRKRDLDTAALIAHQLRSQGVDCFLEPLEAFRAVLAAYRPGMIIFNHLVASHLVAWSKRLADIGVLTAVLSNEGMYLKPDDMRFNSGQFHGDGRLDYFFCWNGQHRDGLVREGFYKGVCIEVVGVPRFDFYFEPWSRLVQRASTEARVRPHILACTNFGLAKYKDLPKEHGDRFYAGWASRMPLYEDYWGAIESHWRSRLRFTEYLAPLVATGRYDITLRPHPTETRKVYDDWIASLSAPERERIRVDADSNISSLILSCDLEISGESCTTAVESWIAGKPTIELVFDRHPVLYSEERSRGNVHCDDPARLPDLVERQLANPLQTELQAVRREYLEKWCATPDGNACRRVAEIAAAAVKSKEPANWAKLNANDYRRAAKLKTWKSLGLAYHFDPLLPMKSWMFKDRYAIKQYAYEKSIKPGDVAVARRLLERTVGLPAEGA